MHDLEEGILENILFGVIKLLKIPIKSIEEGLSKMAYKNDWIKISGSHRGKESSFKIKGNAANSQIRKNNHLQ